MIAFDVAPHMTDGLLREDSKHHHRTMECPCHARGSCTSLDESMDKSNFTASISQPQGFLDTSIRPGFVATQGVEKVRWCPADPADIHVADFPANTEVLRLRA